MDTVAKYLGGIKMNNKPRWIKEIPKPIKLEKRKLTKEEKKEAKDFENAVKNGKIDEWFNNQDT